MRQQFVIECDTEFHSVFVYEVTRNYDADGYVVYRHLVGEDAIIQEFPAPKFYGKLDALLITKDRIEQAAPVTPEVEAVQS